MRRHWKLVAPVAVTERATLPPAVALAATGWAVMAAAAPPVMVAAELVTEL